MQPTEAGSLPGGGLTRVQLCVCKHQVGSMDTPGTVSQKPQNREQEVLGQAEVRCCPQQAEQEAGGTVTVS